MIKNNNHKVIYIIIDEENIFTIQQNYYFLSWQLNFMINLQSLTFILKLSIYFKIFQKKKKMPLLSYTLEGKCWQLTYQKGFMRSRSLWWCGIYDVAWFSLAAS